MSDADKKIQALCYVDMDAVNLWENIPKYDNSVSYKDFVKVIYKLYPGSKDEQKWSIADMENLITDQNKVGITDAQDYVKYYHQFLTITQFLRAKSRLSKTEQSRAFVHGFPASLWLRIRQRLELKMPDHYPDDPYALSDIDEAAKFVLHGATSVSGLARSYSSTTEEAKSSNIKSKDLTSFLNQFAQTLIHVLTPRGARTLYNPNSPAPTSTENQQRALNNSLCNFCGLARHFQNECLVCEQYIKDGKCRRNQFGKIILPSGSYCPRTIPGQWFKDRIDEWH